MAPSATNSSVIVVVLATAVLLTGFDYIRDLSIPAEERVILIK